MTTRGAPRTATPEAASVQAVNRGAAPSPSDVLLEGPAARGGFASDRAAFVAAVAEVADETGLAPGQVTHEYWLVRALHALSERMPQDGVLKGGTAQWAFGGGTSLTTAWGIVRRYSEDIDGVLLVVSADEQYRNLQRATCSQVAKWATDDQDISAPAPDGNRVLTSYFAVGEVTRYIKFETSIIETQAQDLVVPKEIRSLLHAKGDPQWAENYPEIGGFELPCMRPSWIAVNKFDALHRRAVARDFDGIRRRGRDLYDLWALAARPEAAQETRALAPALWMSAASGLGRHVTQRPAAGYADSPAFAEGSPGYEALREGYRQAVDNTVWGDKPRFETAVRAARSLDSTDRRLQAAPRGREAAS